MDFFSASLTYHKNYFFFFLIIPPPPISTLFPYTTLFRSRSAFPSAAPGLASIAPTRRARARPADRDRKSTRLNSSHSSISYAVLCLKKKRRTLAFCARRKKKKIHE